MMAMRYLAEHAEKSAHSARDIAKAYRIPQQGLAKILQALTRADLAVSCAGSSGGYMLARPAKSINAFEVISALDDPLVITNCTTAHGRCEGYCKVQEPLRRVNDSIKTLLSNISIADLTESVDSDTPAVASGLISIDHRPAVPPSPLAPYHHADAAIAGKDDYSKRIVSRSC